jgi:hypothetical protein
MGEIMDAVRHELNIYQRLRERLRKEFPESDEDTLLDTLEGISNLHEMLAEVIRSSLEDQCFSRALRFRIKDMEARLVAFEDRAEKKRELVATTMEQASIRRLREADFTASLRQLPPRLAVSEESQIPESFWVSQAPRLDRRGLIEALKSGREIPGVTLSNGGVGIAVRTK